MPPQSTSSESRRPVGPWHRVVLGGVALAVLAVGAIEVGLRAVGYNASVTDDADLWALTWLERGPEDWLVLGSSRSACAIHIDALSAEVGAPVTQLAVSGGEPVPILMHLAQTGFDGDVLLEVSPELWFADDPVVTQLTQSRIDAVGTMQDALFGKAERRATVWFQERLRVLHSEADLFDLAKSAVKGQVPRASNELDADRQRRCFPTEAGAPAAVALGPQVTAAPQADRVKLSGIANAVLRVEHAGGTVWMYVPPEGPTKLESHTTLYPDALYADVLAEQTGAVLVKTADSASLRAFDVPDHSHIDASDAPAYSTALARELLQRR